MHKICVIVAIVVCAVGLFGTALWASERNGDPKLCRSPWRSWSTRSNITDDTVRRSQRIISQCTALSSDSLDIVESAKFSIFLDEVDEELWKSGRLPKKVLYRYTLRIDNDWHKHIRVNLSGWEVTHSAYTSMVQDFAIGIPPYSYVSISFLSPWAPELHESRVSTGYVDEERGWEVSGDGSASILVPVWYQFYPEGMLIERLPDAEIQSKVPVSD